MKLTRFSILVMLFVGTVSLPNTFAQDYTQWHLPEGAKARLGKGAITSNVQYSRMALGSRSAPLSVFGFTMPIPVKKLTYSQGIRLGSHAWRSLQTDRRLPAEVGTEQFGCGIHIQVNTRQPL